MEASRRRLSAAGAGAEVDRVLGEAEGRRRMERRRMDRMGGRGEGFLIACTVCTVLRISVMLKRDGGGGGGALRASGVGAFFLKKERVAGVGGDKWSMDRWTSQIDQIPQTGAYHTYLSTNRVFIILFLSLSHLISSLPSHAGRYASI